MKKRTGIRRRDLLAGTIPAAAAAVHVRPSFGRQNTEGKSSLSAGEVHEYLRSLSGGWVHWEYSVDTFKSGDPADVVTGIGVAWMPYEWALKAALDQGCNCFVTHEPTYYNHTDTEEEIFRFESVRSKRRFIEESGMTIIRCHDVWDRYPRIGIPEAWGTLLGFPGPIDKHEEGFWFAYDGEGRTVLDLAKQVARRLSPLGQPGVQLIGPEDRRIRRIVIGCGAISPMLRFIDEMEADLAICSDDGFTYWRDGAFAIDADFPVIVVNHAVSEENGVRLLAQKLADRFAQVPVHHIPEKCMYRIVEA